MILPDEIVCGRSLIAFWFCLSYWTDVSCKSGQVAVVTGLVVVQPVFWLVWEDTFDTYDNII